MYDFIKWQADKPAPYTSGWDNKTFINNGEFIFNNEDYKVRLYETKDKKELLQLYKRGQLKHRGMQSKWEIEFFHYGDFNSSEEIFNHLYSGLYFIKNEKVQEGDLIFCPQKSDRFWWDNFNGYFVIESLDKENNIARACNGKACGFGEYLNKGPLSISGGPWEGFDLNELKESDKVEEITRWNWGLNGPGGDKGVYFKVNVRVWIYEPKEKENNENSN